MNKILVIAFALVANFTSANEYNLSSPRDLVMSINTILNKDSGLDEIESIVVYDYITKISFNKYWKKMNKDEKGVSKLYTTNKVLDIYKKSFTAFDGLDLQVDKVKFNKKGNKAQITLHTTTFKGIQMYASFSDNEWKVYDLGFEGLRLSRAIKKDIEYDIKTKSLEVILVKV
jgi:ABC-type transporter MlaC component